MAFTLSTCSKVAGSQRGIGACCLFVVRGLEVFRPALEVVSEVFFWGCMWVLRTRATIIDIGASTGQSRLSFALRHEDLMMVPGGEAVCLVFKNSLSSENGCADCQQHCNSCCLAVRVSARIKDPARNKDLAVVASKSMWRSLRFRGKVEQLLAGSDHQWIEDEARPLQLLPSPSLDEILGVNFDRATCPERVRACTAHRATTRQPRAVNADLVDVSVDGDSPVGEIVTRNERQADATSPTDPDTLRGVHRAALNGGHHGTGPPERVDVGDVEASCARR